MVYLYKIKQRIQEILYGGKYITIPKNALVLEVASGGKPYWRSDILVDNYIVDDTERCSHIIIDRPFFQADVHHLPFKDKVFDFVIARHILEHLAEPEKFLHELERIARAGYIETPSSFSEQMLGWPFHILEVDTKGNHLIISNKDSNNKQLQKLKTYHDTDKYFKSFLLRNRDILYTSFYWQDKIPYKLNIDGSINKIIESTDSLFPANFKPNYSLKKRIKIFMDKIRRNLSSPYNKIDFSLILRCPDCGNNHFNKSEDDIITCSKCSFKQFSRNIYL